MHLRSGWSGCNNVKVRGHQCVPRRPRHCLRLTVSLIILFALSFFVDILVTRQNAFYNPPPPQFNYFLEADEYSKMGYVVNTSECRILNISAWDKSILPFVSHPVPPSSTQCHTNRQWTYIDDHQRLVMNVSAIGESGYTISSINCCYRPITRIDQPLDDFDIDADNLVSYSDDCKEMKKEVTEMKDQFIRVLCKSKYWPWSMDIIYRYFHAIPLPHSSSPNSTAKISFWAKKWKHKKKNSKKTKLRIPPPNVLLVGIDSMSRLSFQRNMQKTREYLQDIGAVEMLGYTKLGENTFPNAVAFSTGYTTNELSKVCNYSMSKALDPCPFIWKDYNKANYLTALIEDVPFLATFNYFKTGFLRQPTDFYFRPFMLGVHYHAPRMSYYSIDCIGRQTVDETIHKYIENILKISSREKTPSFIYTWLTNLAHVDLNAPKFADTSYTEFLTRLNLTHEESNTILFFMSDHGYRYGLIRQTFAGWYEDKLPNFWVFIPPRIRKAFPDWEKALNINAKRLSSPLDLHATLLGILETFGKSSKDKTVGDAGLPNRKGQTLFKEIDSKRRCKEAGISDNFCACVAPRRLELNNTHLKIAAESALIAINSLLPSQCTQLTLNNIIAGGIMDKSMDDDSKGATYIVAFDTTQGQFLFEANVDYWPAQGRYTMVGELLRMNKINTDVSCVKSDFLEKFCYCSETN